MSNLQGKRLLFLGGAVQCCKVVEAAKRLGVYTIVTDINASRPMREIADEILPYSVKDVDGIADWCTKNHVDGIMNLCIDAAQKVQEQLCRKFGFPCYGTPEQVFALTNKEEFKRVCSLYGIDTIPKYEEEDVEKGTIEYPVLVKPAESSGSRGLTICANEAELRGALAQAKATSNNGKAIIEKYMGGCMDFTMSYFVIDGVPYLYCTHDRYLGLMEYGLDRQCVCQYGPSKYLDMYLEKVDQKFKNMLIGLGLQNAPVFFQGFIDGDKLRVYDPGIRFPGTEYETAFHRATGVDLMEMIVKYALEESISEYAALLDGSYRLNGMRTASLMIDCRPGKIGSYQGLPEIAQIPEVTRASQKAFVGDTIPETGDVKQRVCEVTLLCEDAPAHIEAVIKQIQSLIKITDENGENMVISPFDTKHVYEYI